MARSKRNRNTRRARSAPLLHVLEAEALATADSAITGTIYSPTLSTSALLTTQFTLHTSEVAVTTGATTARVYAVIRKVPDGYANPSITVSDSINVFQDSPNVLAYGYVQVYAASSDAMNKFKLRMRQRSITMHPGDKIVIQLVSDTSSVGQAINSLTEFSVAT